MEFNTCYIVMAVLLGWIIEEWVNFNGVQMVQKKHKTWIEVIWKEININIQMSIMHVNVKTYNWSAKHKEGLPLGCPLIQVGGTTVS